MSSARGWSDVRRRALDDIADLQERIQLNHYSEQHQVQAFACLINQIRQLEQTVLTVEHFKKLQ